MEIAEAAGRQQGVDFRIFYFPDFPARRADEMVVLQETGYFFVLRRLVAECVASDEAGVDEQFDGIVDRSAAHAVAVGAYERVQAIDGKV